MVKNNPIFPFPEDEGLTDQVMGVDHHGVQRTLSVIVEHPLTLYLNGQEIVTHMTILDHPRWLGVGYLLNQAMLNLDDRITAMDYDKELRVIIIRTERLTDYEEKLKKRTQTSGCAQGTVFGDIAEQFEKIHFPDKAGTLPVSILYSLAKKITHLPSLYLKVGAVHGCVLSEGDRPLIYMEDVGRHNAVDKIAGYMFLHNVVAEGKIFYTTGRLTSEMVLKAAQMGLSIVVSRSGFTARGVALARMANMTLIGRLRGKRFLALSGEKRLSFDADPRDIDDVLPGREALEDTP